MSEQQRVTAPFELVEDPVKEGTYRGSVDHHLVNFGLLEWYLAEGDGAEGATYFASFFKLLRHWVLPLPVGDAHGAGNAGADEGGNVLFDVVVHVVAGRLMLCGLHIPNNDAVGEVLLRLLWVDVAF